ncbi:MAG: hypothetical protein AAFY41_15805, partial [Bacteroidota bacterium]
MLRNRYFVVNRKDMDVQVEKRNIITRLEAVTDESLIMTVKNLLDYALGKAEEDELLEQSLARGIHLLLLSPAHNPEGSSL